PDGSVATRHGPGDIWTFEYGEQRGNRFFSDKNGAFVQEVDYQPFGKPTPTGAPTGDQRYSSKQWNFGDSLASLRISQLGARLSAPVLGRFTSRDPLLNAGGGTTSNPYAFADNDPVNLSDPSGLQPADPDDLPLSISRTADMDPFLSNTGTTSEIDIRDLIPPDFGAWESVGRHLDNSVDAENRN